MFSAKNESFHKKVKKSSVDWETFNRNKLIKITSMKSAEVEQNICVDSAARFSPFGWTIRKKKKKKRKKKACEM